MARKLTERQQKFIDALFSEANGSIKDAKIIAGYSPNTNNQEIIKGIKDEIFEATHLHAIAAVPQISNFGFGSFNIDPIKRFLEGPRSIGNPSQLKSSICFIIEIFISNILLK